MAQLHKKNFKRMYEDLPSEAPHPIPLAGVANQGYSIYSKHTHEC